MKIFLEAKNRTGKFLKIKTENRPGSVSKKIKIANRPEILFKIKLRKCYQNAYK